MISLVQHLTQCAQGYVVGDCPRIDARGLSALGFLREYVSINFPVVLTNAVTHWPALDCWRDDVYFNKLRDAPVSVNATPNGLADAVVDGYFCLPEERMMSMPSFLCELANPRAEQVLYLSKQDNNLMTQFPELAEDCSPDFPLATEAFGRQPDAVNLWVGDARSTTSLHWDHYENMYVVVCGAKHFTLYPPTELPAMSRSWYTQRQHRFDGVDWHLDDIDSPKIPWITFDPVKPIARPGFEMPRGVQVTVEAGEVLYLPAQWMHHVQQEDRTFAVNYWYDMEFGLLSSYNDFMDRVSLLLDEDERKSRSY